MPFFCTNIKFWPISANLCYFVTNLRAFWCFFKGPKQCGGVPKVTNNRYGQTYLYAVFLYFANFFGIDLLSIILLHSAQAFTSSPHIGFTEISCKIIILLNFTSDSKCLGADLLSIIGCTNPHFICPIPQFQLKVDLSKFNLSSFDL